MPFGPIQRYFNIIYLTGDDCAMNPKGLFQRNDVSVLSVSLKASSRPQSVVTTHHQYLPTRLSKYFAIQEPHQGKLFKGLNSDIFQTAAVPFENSALKWNQRLVDRTISHVHHWKSLFALVQMHSAVGKEKSRIAILKQKKWWIQGKLSIIRIQLTRQMTPFKTCPNPQLHQLWQVIKNRARSLPTRKLSVKESEIWDEDRAWMAKNIRGLQCFLREGVGGGGLTEATLNHWRVPQVSAEKHWWRKSPFQQPLHTDK